MSCRAGAYHDTRTLSPQGGVIEKKLTKMIHQELKKKKIGLALPLKYQKQTEGGDLSDILNSIGISKIGQVLSKGVKAVGRHLSNADNYIGKKVVQPVLGPFASKIAKGFTGGRRVEMGRHPHRRRHSMRGGISGSDVSNYGTAGLKALQENVLYKAPVVGDVLKFVGNNAEDVVNKVFGIKPKTLQSALNFEKTGISGYETDHPEWGHGVNLNGNLNDYINVLELRSRKSIRSSPDQSFINSLKSKYLESPVKGVIFPMPKRHNKDVLDWINQGIEMGILSPDNLDKYYDWNDRSDPRLVPGSGVYEKGDPPTLVTNLMGGRVHRRRLSSKKRINYKN